MTRAPAATNPNGPVAATTGLGGSGVAEWVEAVATVALIGTARRPLPAPADLPASAAALATSRPGATPEVALLDAVAVTAALRRAGTRAGRNDGSTSSAVDDVRLPPPPRARQLLDVLLTQTPVGTRLAPATLAVWLRAADAHGCRAPHPALVGLLEKATAAEQLRAPVRAVLDNRGTWLASQNATWSWALTGTSPSGVVPDRAAPAGPVVVDPHTWSLLPTLERAVLVRQLRAVDPDAGRELVESTWGTDPAAARTDLLATLSVGLSLTDEPFLERALDDRAGGVRDGAYRLLDALPDSARAGRLAELLTPLLSTTGLVRKKVVVELPTTPTKAAVRDGLTAGPRGRSERGFWLQRLAAGAPLQVWTDVTRLDPETIVRTLEDTEALAGLRSATVARRDQTWARALLDRTWDPGVARCLQDAEVNAHMLTRVDDVKTVAELAAVLSLSTSGWDPRASTKIVARLAQLDHAPQFVDELVPILADSLHPSTAPAVAALVEDDATSTDSLHRLAQHLSLVSTITEAFA